LTYFSFAFDTHISQCVNRIGNENGKTAISLRPSETIHAL
jgi:hypothetical protein